VGSGRLGDDTVIPSEPSEVFGCIGGGGVTVATAPDILSIILHISLSSGDQLRRSEKKEMCAEN
jgi:hypothetical protein